MLGHLHLGSRRVLPLLLLLWTAACQSTANWQWPRSTLAAEGIDRAPIDALVADIEAGSYGLVDHLLLIRHADNWMTAYAHSQVILVRRGDRVKRGQTIARVGSTGNVTRPQLHFKIRKGDEAVNPTRHL